ACFTVHDHPGRATSFFLGVPVDGTVRHDLGFYELLYTIALFVVVQLSTRRPRPDGWVIALAATSYAPVRFALDFLGVRDATYAGLTPGLCAGLGLLGVGVGVLARLRASERAGSRAHAAPPTRPRWPSTTSRDAAGGPASSTLRVAL